MSAPHRGGLRHDPDAPLRELHEAYARSRAPHTLAELAAAYDRYAVGLAQRLHRYGEPLEDLEQVAREALLVALQRFDPARGIPFAGYATPTIMGAIRRHYRDHGWSVRVPRWVHETNVAVRWAAEELSTCLGRLPTTSEIADHLGTDPDRVRRTEQAVAARSPGSLDAELGEGSTGHDVVGTADRAMVDTEHHIDLCSAMAALGDRERELIGLYYFEDLSQREIADRYGVSQMQVSRLLSSAVGRIRARVAN